MYAAEPDRWEQLPGLAVGPVLLDARLSSKFLPEREYSQHPPGLALLTAPLVFPFRGSAGIESAAIVITVIVVALAAWLFDLLLSDYLANGVDRTWIVTAMVLGTPVWHYARTFYPEPYLMLLAIAAYLGVLRYSAYLWAGVLIGLGAVISPGFALVGLPIVCRAAMEPLPERKLKQMLSAGLPIVISLSALALWNDGRFGRFSPLAIAWAPGDPLTGPAGILLSPTHGLLPCAPVAMVALILWPGFLRRRRDAKWIGMAVLLYAGCAALGPQWDGGFCYGPRLFVPVLPLLLLSLSDLPSRSISRAQFWTCGALLFVSIVFNGVAAFGCGFSLNRHPLQIIFE